MFYPCNRYRPRRLKYRRLNEAGTDGRADKAGSQKSWAELTDAFRLEPNQILSCYLARKQPGPILDLINYIVSVGGHCLLWYLLHDFISL